MSTAQISRSPNSCLFLLAVALCAMLAFQSRKHGLVCWPDSVHYLLAADNFVAHGTLAVPLTDWSDPQSTELYHHHGPLLPWVLGTASRISNLPTDECAKILNCAAILTITVSLILCNASGWPGAMIAALFLISPVQLTWAYGILSEPLFLALLSLMFLAVLREPAPSLSRHLLLTVCIGIIGGLAILTRYAGLFIVPVMLVAWAVKTRAGLPHKLLSLLISGLCCAAVSLPWFLHLRESGEHARTLNPIDTSITTAIQESGITVDSIRESSDELSSYLAPSWLPLKLRLCVVVLGACCVSTAFWRLKTWPVAAMGAAVAAIYSGGVLIAKVVADHSIPLDGRIFSPAYLALVFGAVAAIRTPTRTCTTAACMFLAGMLCTQYIRTVDGQTWGVRNDGGGWFKAGWTQTDAMQFLRAVPSETTIYSNAADGVAVVLRGHPVKWSSQNSDADVQAFAATLAKSGGVFAYFPDDFRSKRLLSDSQLALFERLAEPQQMGDAILFVIRPGT